MKGAVNWKSMRAELPQDMQDRLDEKLLWRRVGQAMAELRKQSNLTQSDVAENASMPQSNISRTENSDDMLLSSIGRYMQALGGSAELILRGPGGTELRIDIDPTGLTEI